MSEIWNLVSAPETEEKSKERLAQDRGILLCIRLFTLVVMVVGLTTHLKTIRLFRWESTVSGGLLVTYAIVAIGLVICVVAEDCGGRVFQAFICISGSIFLLVNAAAIYYRWRQSNQMTQVVAELLVMMGITVRRQVYTKIFLSLAAGLGFLVDVCSSPFLGPSKNTTVPDGNTAENFY